MHEELLTADLIVDAVYQGGRAGNASDDPLPKLVGVSNQGGFRYLGNKNKLNMVVLITGFDDPDWPDELDPTTGIFTYYGDNKKPGNELHNTPRFGNQILRDLFAIHHDETDLRRNFPPILLFSKAGNFRDIKFLGLAVPGARSLSSNDDLVAVWKSSTGKRYQNYRAKFTVLDVPKVSRAWLTDVQNGLSLSSHHVPKEWSKWVVTGVYTPLTASPAVEHRSKQEQLPDSEDGWEIIRTIHQAFSDNPYAFEKCAGEILRFLMPNVATLDLTRPSRDGGRDAVGTYKIGTGPSSIEVEFAMEAKCYNPETGSVGVKETSRLISRLRHRQFGVMVTTSYLNSQAYRELTDDRHPVIIIAASDISRIIRKEFPGLPRLKWWLDALR